MRRLSLVGLMRMDLPGGAVRLCDGGVIRWGSETYAVKDPTYGAIGAIEDLTEGVGSEMPVMGMTLLPPDSAAPAAINSAANQAATVQFWTAAYDPETGAVVGAPEIQFIGLLDSSVLTFSEQSRELQVTLTPLAERLLNKSEGNSLSPTFHKSVWPGETGMDDASGLLVMDYWGTESGSSSGASLWGGVARKVASS
ncbi:hypothetical protein [Novosphingobium olei]|uniref:hypothetical protein n=1 Tax=Novosphingobium olei TaxID=2728851 RepID=UPI00308B61FC|nr:DUF2163 domain-containing protein [Novosphingobium olei]